MKEKWRVFPGATWMVNLPSKSVIAPSGVSKTCMVTPANGPPSVPSVTVPETVTF